MGIQKSFPSWFIGDSGSGPHTDHHPQRRIAEHMVPHLSDCRFLLHTGDVVYQVGSSEQYPENFIKPYREWLVGGDDPSPDSVRPYGFFRFPFLAVPGNHDYYNLPRAYSVFVQLTNPIRQVLGIDLTPNVGWHGSGVGDAYARAFLDYLKRVVRRKKLEHPPRRSLRPLAGPNPGTALSARRIHPAAQSLLHLSVWRYRFFLPSIPARLMCPCPC